MPKQYKKENSNLQTAVEDLRGFQVVDRPVSSHVPNRPPLFVSEMRLRAQEAGLLPHELLALIATDPDAEFDDLLVVGGQLVPIRRKATLKERIDCAKFSAAYYAAPKAQQINQNNTIRIEHSLPSTALDTTVLDEQGRVIEADEISFDDE